MPLGVVCATCGMPPREDAPRNSKPTYQQPNERISTTTIAWPGNPNENTDRRLPGWHGGKLEWHLTKETK